MEIKKRENIPENRQVRLTVAVDRGTWQDALMHCYNGIKALCPVEGEPTREKIEAVYGSDFLYQEAVNETYPQALVDAIGQEDISIAGTPTLTVEDIGPDGFTFTALIDLYPEVKLGQYKGLSAVYPQAELSEEDTQAALEEYARAHMTEEHPDRAAMGDEVVLDFEGFVDGVAFEGGKGESYPLLLGSGYFIPGFEEQVAGARTGEERDIHVTFPTAYTPELAGKDATFHIKVHEITRRSMPTLDDAFARAQGFEELSHLRRSVMEQAVAKKTVGGRRAVRQRPDRSGAGRHGGRAARRHGGKPAGRPYSGAARPSGESGCAAGAVSGVQRYLHGGPPRPRAGAGRRRRPL